MELGFFDKRQRVDLYFNVGQNKVGQLINERNPTACNSMFLQWCRDELGLKIYLCSTPA